jgi:hypothetical protein
MIWQSSLVLLCEILCEQSSLNRSVVTPHRTAWRRSHPAISRWTAGHEGLRGSGRGGKRGTGATATELAASLAPLQPDQQTVGEHDRHSRPVEARPPPALVVIPTPLSLGRCMKLLHRLPAMCLARQRLQ